MGVRTVRYCDITGIASDDVTHHELQIDQMRVEIDLVESEYQRLLQALQPFIDAGHVDASIPTPTAASPTGTGPAHGQHRDLLTDLTTIAAGRTRVSLHEAVASLHQLDPGAYRTWTTRTLAKALPDTAKPYNDKEGRWLSLRNIITARGISTTRHPNKKRRKPQPGKLKPGPRTGLF